MKILNRTSITVTFKKPFIHWNNNLFPDSLMEVNILGESSTYLVTESTGDADKLLRKYYKEIFENELFQMWTDENDWPQKISYELFNEWFSVEIAGFVYDLPKTKIETTEI
ncbi:MAG: hypothetical protein PHS59_08375 [Paludibacter sp.]|nr:hypothetical protein [Paludibacter sp.]